MPGRRWARRRARCGRFGRGRRRHAARSAGPGSGAWLELDCAARSGYHGELRSERVLVHVMEGPAAQPEQRRDGRERRGRGERLPARHADQQPGAGQRDRAQRRHVEPGRLQGAQAWRRGPRAGGVQDPDAGPAGGQRDGNRQVTPGRRGLRAARPAAQPGYGGACQRGEAEYQHGHGLDQVSWHIPQVGTQRGEAEGDLPWPAAGPQRAAVPAAISEASVKAGR